MSGANATAQKGYGLYSQLHLEPVSAFVGYITSFQRLIDEPSTRLGVNRKSDAPGRHLTDGRVTLSIMPWSIEVFGGMSIKRPGPDHIGFHVENLDAFKAHVAAVGGMNPYLAPVPLGGSLESDVRKRFFAAHATGKWQMSDPDGNWIDITDE